MGNLIRREIGLEIESEEDFVCLPDIVEKIHRMKISIQRKSNVKMSINLNMVDIQMNQVEEEEDYDHDHNENSKYKDSKRDIRDEIMDEIRKFNIENELEMKKKQDDLFYDKQKKEKVFDTKIISSKTIYQKTVKSTKINDANLNEKKPILSRIHLKDYLPETSKDYVIIRDNDHVKEDILVLYI